MLSALLLNKKVLLISHKPAAIEVVRKRINEFLRNEQSVVTILSESSHRTELRGYLSTLNQDAQRYSPFFQVAEIQERKRNIERREGELREKKEQLKKV